MVYNTQDHWFLDSVHRLVFLKLENMEFRKQIQFPKLCESESYVTTDGQPASLPWSKAPIWGLQPDLYYMCDSYGLVLVGRPL
jgi:hypothetical protein